jgi:hypothetical protein
MSAALNTHADSSAHSAGTHPDISLSSMSSGLLNPVKNVRVPSVSSQTTALSSAPLSTPSPSATPSSVRRKWDDAALSTRWSNAFKQEGDTESPRGDLLDTPGTERNRWQEGPDTPGPTRHKRTGSNAGASKGVTLTLRDQEKVRSVSLISSYSIMITFTAYR